MRDRIRFSTACRAFQAVVKRTILNSVARYLRPYNFSLLHFRFLQSCTGTILSGSTVKRLLFVDEEFAPPVFPITLDLYCSRTDADSVVKFVARATGYARGPSTVDVPRSGDIHRVISLFAGASPTINVFATWSSNPMDAIFHLPTSADMGALTLDRIWHAYPRLTFDGLALSTPQRLPLDDLAGEQRVWDVLHANTHLGFRLDSEVELPHTCATSFNCPLTWRTSNDNGCLSIRLGTLPVSAIDTEAIWRDDTILLARSAGHQVIHPRRESKVETRVYALPYHELLSVPSSFFSEYW
ncbi:hypothetical protein C8R43DRAFT_949295 [Mycena crocata]|nr:hypothetical protein C8R43DRAFT_949295 [Mycena crocata]